MAMGDYRTESEEEALFRSHPYAVYLVQSPSNSSDHEPARLALSRYSSSRASNNSFSQIHLNKIFSVQDIDDQVPPKGVDCQEPDEITDEDDYYINNYDKNRGWIRYFSFSYSNSGWWILLQLSWRFLVSFIIALLVFYLAAKPPPPNMSIKIAGIREFRLGEGVDGSGVTTKILSCNCSINVVVDNNSKLFALHIHPPTIQLLFAKLPLAVSQGREREVVAGDDDISIFRLSVGTRNKPMYGAGRNMQDLLQSGNGLPLIIRVSFRSTFNVIWGIIQPQFHHQAQCLLLLSHKYDNKHRTQVYNSTCTINS